MHTFVRGAIIIDLKFLLGYSTPNLLYSFFNSASWAWTDVENEIISSSATAAFRKPLCMEFSRIF